MLSSLYAGQRLTSAVLAAGIPNGVISRGKRVTATSNITGTETGVIRLDSIPVLATRTYLIITSNINMDTSVNNDICACTLRIGTGGAAATTSGTILTTLRQTVDDATNSNIVPLVAVYNPPSDTTLSVLVSGVRVAGTGNLVVFCSTSQPLDLLVIDLGAAPTDTGVIL